MDLTHVIHVQSQVTSYHTSHTCLLLKKLSLSSRETEMHDHLSIATRDHTFHSSTSLLSFKLCSLYAKHLMCLEAKNYMT